MPLSFLDLPRELRDEIYRELFLIEDPVRLFIRERPPSHEEEWFTTDDEVDEEEDDEDEEGDEYSYETVWNSDSSDDGDPNVPPLPRRPIGDAYGPKKETPPKEGFPALVNERDSLVLATSSRVLRSSTHSTDYGHKNALLRTNRQISQEACVYLYSHTRFVVSPDYRLCYDYYPIYPFWGSEALREADGVCVLNTFFNTIGTNAQHIRHFWFTLTGFMEWELLCMCLTLLDRCPSLQSLKLAEGRFLDPECALRHFDISYRSKPIGRYFVDWMEVYPELLAEFYDEVAKMLGLDRIILQ